MASQPRVLYFLIGVTWLGALLDWHYKSKRIRDHDRLLLAMGKNIEGMSGRYIGYHDTKPLTGPIFIDMLFKTRRAHYEIREIPTTWRDVTGSKLRVGPVSFQMFLAICRLRLLYSPCRWVVALYDRLLGRVIALEPRTR